MSEFDNKDYDILDEDQEQEDLEEELDEATHNKYAKPEGNKIKSFNNALKYAKRSRF